MAKTESTKTLKEWITSLIPLKRTGYFNEKRKFRVCFDENETLQIQEKTDVNIKDADAYRIAILTAFGLKDERVTEVKADTTDKNKNVDFQKLIDFAKKLKNVNKLSITDVCDRMRTAGYDDSVIQIVTDTAFDVQKAEKTELF